MDAVSIYVLPSEPDLPPRAVVGMVVEAASDDQEGAIAGVLATWSADTGVWLIEGELVSADLSEAITSHARDLGVPGF